MNPLTDLKRVVEKAIEHTAGGMLLARHPSVVALRNGILAELARTDRKIMKPEEIHFDELSKNAEYIFQDMPEMARVGQYPPRGYLEAVLG
jgi:hypothetical protein